MGVLLATFCLYGIYNCIKAYEQQSPFENSSEGSSEMELEHTSKHRESFARE